MPQEVSIMLDPKYKDLISILKQKISSARIRAALAVSIEQIRLYWEIGKCIVEQQQTTQWGGKLLECVSKDLCASFPDMKGFSRSNVHYMKQFAENYSDFVIVQQTVGQLPWGHIVILIQKVKEADARNWYINQTIENGWARDKLERYISNDLFDRQGIPERKVTNFKDRLPAPQSDLANQLIKEPYDFGFMPSSRDAKERDIERNLVEHVRDFLLELGTGFAFVGNQYHVEVNGDDFYIDLLFFNLKLNCYFVIELKTGKFKPEYAGKLNFYISVVDNLLKDPHHNRTIGLLLCENKNRIVAEYSLNKIENPMGISEYQLSRVLPDAMRAAFPPVDLIEDKLSEEITNKEELELME